MHPRFDSPVQKEVCQARLQDIIDQRDLLSFHKAIHRGPTTLIGRSACINDYDGTGGQVLSMIEELGPLYHRTAAEMTLYLLHNRPSMMPEFKHYEQNPAGRGFLGDRRHAFTDLILFSGLIGRKSPLRSEIFETLVGLIDHPDLQADRFGKLVQELPMPLINTQTDRRFQLTWDDMLSRRNPPTKDSRYLNPFNAHYMVGFLGMVSLPPLEGRTLADDIIPSAIDSLVQVNHPHYFQGEETYRQEARELQSQMVYLRKRVPLNDFRHLVKEAHETYGEHWSTTARHFFERLRKKSYTPLNGSEFDAYMKKAA